MLEQINFYDKAIHVFDYTSTPNVFKESVVENSCPLTL